MALIKELARDAAQQALRDYWDGWFPVDPAKIATKLGMTVWDADLSPNESGRIVKRAGSNADIFLSRSEPETRRNFTCAHELGHWFERQRANDDEYSFVDKRDDSVRKDAHEWFAEHFAANLLMPEKEFIEAVDDGLSIRELMTRFGASRAAVSNRAKNLKVSIEP